MTNEHRRLTLYLHDPPLLSVLEHVHVHVSVLQIFIFFSYVYFFVFLIIFV